VAQTVFGNSVVLHQMTHSMLKKAMAQPIHLQPLNLLPPRISALSNLLKSCNSVGGFVQGLRTLKRNSGLSGATS
jgi:hypothetical protein